jgi:RNA polymerase sigma-70 factor (ECF subfamily)
MEQPLAPLAPTPGMASAQPERDPYRNGDPALFERIMRLYNRRLFRLAFGLIGDADEAEDVLQDSYLQAFLHLSSFAGRASMGAWLASIVRNRAIDHLRARQLRRTAFALESELREVRASPPTLERVPASAESTSPEFDRQRDDVRAVLETAIALLPGQFRSVFVMREIEGLSLQQTAVFLGIPVATVKSRDHRARALLRAALGNDFAGDPRQVLEFLRERCDRLVARVLRRLMLL